MSQTIVALVSLFGIAAGVVGRVLFIRHSEGVDNYYWILVARSFRQNRKPPAVLPGKYLLEDQRQFYPPLFGQFLSFFSERFLRSRGSVLLPVAIDLSTLFAALLLMVQIGLPDLGFLIVAAIYISAPVLVSYNYQLTSRGLGNLFLTVALLSQVVASHSGGSASYLWWAISATAIGAVISTHKMSTQFLIFLTPIWMFALTPGELAWQSPACLAIGLLLAAIYTGVDFQKMQWRAHFDIVSFWNRNWKWLGAHQFEQSDLYGDSVSDVANRFHQPGLGGVLRHCITVVGYLPTLIATIVTLVWLPVQTHAAAWAVAALAIALATLLLSPLKLFGGGHLYMFNAVVPASLWWGDLLITPTAIVVGLYCFSMVVTAFSLATGLNRRIRRGPSADEIKPVIDLLNTLPPCRVAVFPFTFSDRFALETAHSIFWGAHSIGFENLEPYWPVASRMVSEMVDDYGLDVLAVDTVWWPNANLILQDELSTMSSINIGRWEIYLSEPVQWLAEL